MQLETNVWVGPVLSGYGTHLVFVNNKIAAEPFPLNEVKEQVLADYLDEKNKELVKLFMDNLLAKYEVIILKEKTDKQ
jgi:parvulin-like peptidyl-prolyl isomerase